MNPLLINTYDRGGAANACLRLHEGLLQQKINSKVLLRNKTNTQIPETYQISLQTIEGNLKDRITKKTINILKELKLYKQKSKVDKLAFVRPKELEMYSYPFSEFDITKSIFYQQADIINLHWVANFLDYSSFFKKNKKPIVWTLHDQNPFLPFEHYAEEIVGVDKKGYPLKRNFTNIERKVFQKYKEIKKEIFLNFKNLHIVVLCNWMKEEVNKSEIFKNYSTTIIPNGINSNVFKPRDKYYSRELLNIPPDKKVLLYISDSVDKKRKGFVFLQRAFEQLKGDDIVLLSIGSNNSLINSKNHFELGFISDELLMSIVYSAADVFVIPSLMDNLPNTVLESLLCGTPVIGFPVGGITDMVKEGKNGYTTKEISVSALTETINKFLENLYSFDKNKIRENAVKKYDLSVQTKNYIKLYQSINY